jgi:hypothetical protein
VAKLVLFAAAALKTVWQLACAAMQKPPYSIGR